MKIESIEKKYINLKGKEVSINANIKYLQGKQKNHNNQNIDIQIQNATKKINKIREKIKTTYKLLEKNRHTYIIKYKAELVDSKGYPYTENFTENFSTTVFCDVDTTKNNELDKITNFNKLISKVSEFLWFKFSKYEIFEIKLIRSK